MTVIALVRCNGRVRRKPLTVIFVTDTCVTRSIFTSLRLIDERYSKCQYEEAHIMHMFVYFYGKNWPGIQFWLSTHHVNF